MSWMVSLCYRSTKPTNTHRWSHQFLGNFLERLIHSGSLWKEAAEFWMLPTVWQDSYLSHRWCVPNLTDPKWVRPCLTYHCLSIRNAVDRRAQQYTSCRPKEAPKSTYMHSALEKCLYPMLLKNASPQLRAWNSIHCHQSSSFKIYFITVCWTFVPHFCCHIIKT